VTTVDVRIGSLFSGYGGLDLGVQAKLGGAVVWHAEVDPNASRVLAHHWPDVPNLGDITRVDWSQVDPVDVLTGGFPCQDVSSAGKRVGLRPGTRSGLWSQMAYVVSVLRPRLVIAENVRGLLSAPAASDVEPCPWCLGEDTSHALRALGAVLGDLADLGYDTAWCGLRASDVGAPHQRFRVFVAATDTHQPRSQGRKPAIGRDLSARSPATHAASDGHRDAGAASVGELPQAAVPGHQRDGAPGHRAPAAHAASDRRGERQPELPGQQGRGEFALGRVRAAAHAPDGHEADQHPMGAPSGGPGRRVGSQLGAGARTGAGHPAARVHELGPGARGVDFGGYEPAIQRWEHLLGRLAPAPTIEGQRRSRVLNPAFVEWMQGLDEGHVTAVPGLSRNAMLRILGNGVVPQQAAAATPWLLAALDTPLGEVA
jgi:DNA (cytosine-5)-methyltransferase 1